MNVSAGCRAGVARGIPGRGVPQNTSFDPATRASGMIPLQAPVQATGGGLTDRKEGWECRCIT